MIKVAIIGLGHLGKWHVDKAMACGEAELVCAVDPSEGAQAVLDERGLKIPLFKSIEDCLSLIDAAFVVTPTSFHFDICKVLLKAGKHVFCEKPMTSTFEQANQLQALVGNQVFQVGHSERFHNIWQQVDSFSEYLADSPVVTLERQAPFKGRATDVDVVQDLMIHDIDLVLFLLKEKPSHVFSVGKKQRTDKWDFAKAFFTFSSGTQATITVGRNHVQETRIFESVNSKGCLRVDLFASKLLKASSSSLDVLENSYDKRDHLLEEHKGFYAAILDRDKRPPVTIEDGRDAVYLVEKVIESLEKGMTVEC